MSAPLRRTIAVVGATVLLSIAVLTAARQPKAQSPMPATFGIGRLATAEDIAARDIDIGPDGVGLPPGRGTSAQGAVIYAARCASCHGKSGTEGPNDVLVGRIDGGGFPFSRDPKAPRTVGTYWPFATTLFDYIRRAMPTTAPGTLTDDEVYALVAHLLARNGIVHDDAIIDAQSLPKVRMPARDRFVPDSRVGVGKPPQH